MVEIKALQIDEVNAFHNLLLGLAKNQGQEEYVLTDVSQIKQAIAESKFYVLLALVNNEPVGYASYTLNYSIWLGSNFVNLDDLFVLGKFRGQKIGNALMEELKKVSQALGVTRIRWEVETDNVKAIKFYENLGAVIKEKGVFNWHLT